MKRVTKADFDFSKAAEYRKTILLAKSHVRVAEREEEIVSHHSEGIETVNIAYPGDYVIKTKVEGDGYVMQMHRFPQVYEEDTEHPGFYRNKVTRMGLLALEDCAFMTPWGQEQNLIAGGVLIEADEHIYGIDRHSFIRNYARVGKAPERETVVAVSEPLEVQLEKVQALELSNHISDVRLRMAHISLFTKHST